MGKWQTTGYSKFILKPHFHEAAFKIKIPCIESSVFFFFFTSVRMQKSRIIQVQAIA